MSKLAKVTDCSSIIGFGSSKFVHAKTPKMDRFTFYDYLGYVVVSPFFEEDPFISGFVVALFFGVSEILGLSTRSKIFPSIVQAISVPMIYTLLAFHEKSVHVDKTLRMIPFTSSNSIERRFTGRPKGSPIESRHGRIIFSIHKGILSFGKRYDAIRWIKRLDNSVTLHGVFHDSYSNRDCAVWPHLSILQERWL